MKHREQLDHFLTTANSVILDKSREIQLALTCLLAGGHLLIEDIPGVGKTTLVQLLARLLNLKTSRIQFTNDLLPGDILGSSIFDSEHKRFTFHPGPIFAELVLADELNRATPKTQSACLQAMEEQYVTVDGITHKLPTPFFVVATQNPRSQIGTFSLPESQLDRFLMRIQLGYPSRQAEKELLMGKSRRVLIENLQPIFSPQEVLELQSQVRAIHTSDAIIHYVQDLVDQTRVEAGHGRGLSPRGALSLIHASQAWAFLQFRNMVIPEDVQAVAVAVMSHRLNATDDFSGETGRALAHQILSAVRVD